VLDRVLDEVPEERPQPNKTMPAPDDLDSKKLLQHLARLLEDGDGAAIDVLEQSVDVLAASLGFAVFGEMAAAAHRFDFEAALAALGPALEAAS
jgi:two-component system sensor histidine kinase/response regulator